jgi:membrane fusion protein (multidrug efflux system)
MSQAVSARDIPAASAPARAAGWRAVAAWLRPLLMLLGIAAVLVGTLVLWVGGGGSFSTDDAYVRAAKLSVANDISGIVQSVNVREGQSVRRGDVLLRLDPRQFQYAVDSARAVLQATALKMEAAKRDYQRMLRETASRQAQVDADAADLARFAGLVKSGGVTRAEYDNARFKLESDRQMAGSLEQQSHVQLARLANDPNIDVRTTPDYLEATAKLEEAERQLAHTALLAPFDGVVTSVDSVQPGQYLAAATAALGLVSTTDIWVEAFPKETQLTYAATGDHVVVSVDTYPGRVWSGVLESMSPASGSSFSVLPAQNASGNWVKVVQRIPIRVKLALRPGDPALRDGMSVDVRVETGHKRTLADLF